MKVCIPITKLEGLDSVVSEHFGRAPMHIVVESDSMTWESLEKEGECGSDDESHGHCMPVDLLLKHGVEVVLCKGIGKGAVSRLLSHDIAVYHVEAGLVSEAVTQWKSNLLTFVDSRHLCEGHSH